MKKILLFLLTLTLGFSTLQLSAQETVEIGDGTSTTYVTPFNSLWGYSFVEQIYTAAEIDMSGNITSISFNCSSSDSQTNNITVYMKNVSRSTFSSSSDYESVTAADIVYSGSWSFSQGWNTITLDVPFLYDGSSNLLIAMHEYTSGYSTRYFYYTSTPGAVISFHSDSSDPDPYNIGSYSGSSYTSANRANIRMEILPFGNTCYSPTFPVISDITSDEATLSWTPRDGQTAWEACCLSDSDDIDNANWVSVTDTFYTFTDLQGATHYTAYVRTVCGTETSNYRTTDFYTSCTGDAMPIPFSEDFEGTWIPSLAFGQTHDAPLCWAIYDGGATSTSYQWNWRRQTTTHSGSASAGCYTDYNTGGTHHNDWLITPPITLTGTQQVTFYAQRSNSSTDEPEEISIWISDEDVTLTAPTSTTSPLPGFTQVTQFNIPAGEWQLYEIPLTDYSGNRRVAFVRRNSPDDGYWLRLDDITIDDIPTCTRPVYNSVTTSHVSATTVDVNWISTNEEGTWEVVVVPTGADVATGTPEPASTHPFTVSDLNDNTTYDVYVRTVCGYEEYSDWTAPATFTTHPFCTSPIGVTISQITGTSAMVSWNEASYGANSYTVEYSVANQNNWISTIVDGTSYMLSNLEPDTAYDVMVYSNCDPGTADTVEKTFRTNCLVGGNLQIGEGTSTISYLPEYCLYNYSYTQQIYLATEMNGAASINSIAFNASSIENANRHLKIYLMHTSAANSDWLNASSATLVYDATPVLTTGWNTFHFSTPFQYDGASNLAVIVIDATGSWNGTNNFYCHSTSQSLSHYIYQDDSPYSISSIPSSGSSGTPSSRNNVIFGIPCDEEATCVRPNVYVTETSENSITLDWAPGYTESSWTVEYSDNNSNWIPAGTTNTHPYEVTGLNADTKYYFRVSSDCGSEQSDWATATARTECGAITSLPYFNNFDEVISDHGTNFITCWSRYTTNPDRVVRCYGSAVHSGSYSLDFNYSPSCTTAVVTPMLDASIPLNMVMLDFWAYSGLAQGWMEVGTMSDPNDFSTYEFYDTVRLSAPNTWENLVISFENYTGSNQYIAFLEINGTTTSYIFDDFTINYATNCLHPTNLAVDSVTDNSVTLSWTEVGNATSWVIEYGSAGFTPGNGTSVPASTNPFTVDNLPPAITYDFYVYADCSDEQSTPFGPVSATPGQYIMGTSGSSDTLITCGVIIYDNGGPNGNYTNNYDFTLVLYPENPNAVLYLSGISNTESNNWDYLWVYDGVGTSGTELAYYNGLNQTVDVMSQSGPLTLVFHSDGSNVYSGIAVTATCVSCYPPTNLTTSNPTLDGATVSWSGIGDSYVLFLNGDMTTGYPANDTTYTFSGLTSSTLYSVRIASICNGDTSMLSAAATFATSCDAITITADNPWTEDFESYTGSGAQPFVCWATPITYTADNGTAPFVYCGYGQSAHSGVNTAEMKGSINMLVLPEFTNDLSELRLSFWATGYSYTNTNVEIGYITDINDTTTFVSVIANAGTPGPRGGSGGGNGNYMGPFSFSGITAPGARIALRYTGPGSGSSWNVDDFIVEIAPDCESPVKTSVTATNIGGHVATISWIDNDDTHTAWTVYYKESTDSVWNTAPASDTTITLTDLNPLSAYDVYVITNCGITETNPDATHTIHFTTTVACPAPTELTLANVSTNEATITWSGTANSYNVEYGETGFTPGTGVGTEDVATAESFTIMNLNPSTSYTIYINSDCNDNDDSLSTTVSFTFTTTQMPETLPYTADFSATNEWILNNGSCSNYWAMGTVETTHSLFVTNNGTTPGYNTGSSSIVSAEKLLAVGDNASVIISFDVRCGGESTWDYLKVFFAPAETDFPAATSVPDYAAYDYETNAMNFENYLTSYTSSPYKLNLTNDNTLHIESEMPNPYENPTASSAAKLVFVWRNDASQGTQPGAIISNVNVAVNSCPSPTGLTVDNITNNSANISWTSSDEVSAWILEYQAAGESTWTVENITSAPGYTLNNLNTATTYTVRVKSDCTGEESFYQTISFTTSCDIITALPYSENFDNISSGNESAFPTCWTRPIQYSGYPYAVTAYQHSAPASLRFQSLTTTPTTAVTPQFAEDMHNLSLSFWLKAESTSYSGTFEVGVMTDPNDVSTFTSVMMIQPNTNWTEFTIDFDTTAISGANKCIGFRQHSNADNWYYWLDDVEISLIGTPTPPTCNAPTNLNATATAYNTADVTWTAGGSETAWNLQYKAASATNWSSSIAVTTTNYQLTGLTAETAYQVRVQANCGNGNTSDWATANFTTPAAPADTCDAPTNIQVTDITQNSATMTWTAGGNETSWKVGYKVQGASQWQEATVQTTSYDIEGLTANSTYDVRVKAVCAADNESDFISTIFTTEGVGIDNITLANSINLMPNPADNYIELSINSNVVVKEAVVYNAFGQMIQTVQLTENHARIDLSDMAAGMYFVRVNGEGVTATKKFIRK